MSSRLRSYFRERQFNPGLIGLFINPYFLARRGLWKAISEMASQVQGRLLDVGCGVKPYRPLFVVASYTGLDVDSDLSRTRGAADDFYDGISFPYADASFDTVLCNQVLEHVFNPEVFLSEIRRVLVPGGRLLLTVPFVWDEHEQPYDFARYTTFGLRSLMERNGLRVVHQRRLLADMSVIFQLTNAYVYKVLRTRSVAVNLLVNALLLAPISAVGLVAGWLLPGNPDLFLDQLVLAERAHESI